jgi:hypothetical protein
MEKLGWHDDSTPSVRVVAPDCVKRASDAVWLHVVIFMR